MQTGVSCGRCFCADIIVETAAITARKFTFVNFICLLLLHGQGDGDVVLQSARDQCPYCSRLYWPGTVRFCFSILPPENCFAQLYASKGNTGKATELFQRAFDQTQEYVGSRPMRTRRRSSWRWREPI